MSLSAEKTKSVASAAFPVLPGETVTSWALSATREVYYPGKPALAEDRVNYRFINGFVDVGDLPCRRALWADVASRTVKLDRDFEVESINLPGFNRRLEFSGFWHRPTRLARWCKATFQPEQDGNYDFALATCGGVHIWVDGELSAKFEPYARNSEQVTTVTLPLKASGSEVVMLTEELAERDINWYVELTLKSKQSINVLIESEADQATIKELMALARNIRPEQEFTTGGPLLLIVDEPTGQNVEVKAEVLPSVHLREMPPLLSATATMSIGSKGVKIDGIDDMPDGYHALNLTFSVGETKVFRQIGFALLRQVKPAKRAASVAERKQEALDYAAEHGEYRIGRALAILATGRGCTELCQYLIEETLKTIDDRKDCSDFVLVPLLWLYRSYSQELPQTLSDQVRATILGYRYWVDEPGNDVMWFWSENHVLCFHASQYLAASLFPDATFINSGRTGHEQLALAEERLDKWFASAESHGFAEWNSAAYYPIDFIGLIALQHWGVGSVSQRAEVLLTRLFKMIGLHTLGGVAAGSMGRAYDKELRAGPCTELAPFATVAFGEGWLNEGVAALTMFCISDYEPPADFASFVFPEECNAVNAHYVQGYNDAAKLALYKTRSVQLSGSVDGDAGAKGHQQHMLDVRFAAHPFARVWVNHPGEDDPWGHQRPSYWAGNGSMPRVGMHQNVGLMLFDIPQNHRIDFTHIYAPVECFDAWEIHKDWLIVRSGNGFAALTACSTIELVQDGPGEAREFRVAGRKAGWTVVVGDVAGPETNSDPMAKIRELVDATDVKYEPQTLTISVRQPNKEEIELSFEKGLFVDQIQQPFPNMELEPEITFSEAVSV